MLRKIAHVQMQQASADVALIACAACDHGQRRPVAVHLL